MRKKLWTSTRKTSCPASFRQEEHKTKLPGFPRSKDKLAPKAHQRVVGYKRNREADEPRIIVENSNCSDLQSRQRRARSHCKSTNRTPVESARILVEPSSEIQVVDLEHPPVNHEVVANHDSSHWPKKSSVAAKPTQDEGFVVSEQIPR